MSAGGMAVLGVAILLVASRGITRLLRSMRFGIISTALDVDARYGYDIWLAQTMMAFFVIVVTDSFRRKNDARNNPMDAILPLGAVALSCLCVFGNNRTMIIYYMICGIGVLTVAFPKQKKLFYSVIVPIVLVVLISFSLLKQFHIDVTGSGNYTPKVVDVVSTQQSLTAYVCGTESIAKTYHLYGERGNQMQLLTFFSDIVNKTSILGLPGLNKLVILFRNVPTSYSLAMYNTEIVPVTGQTLFYGGYLFGWILDIVAFWAVMRLLVKAEVRSKLSKDTSEIYIFMWIAGIFSFCMCRSLAVMYANCTYIPFYLGIAVWVNQKIRLRVQRVNAKNEYC